MALFFLSAKKSFEIHEKIFSLFVKLIAYQEILHLKLRDLIIGKELIASRAEFKRLMLTGYLAIISMIVAVIYAVLDVLNNVYYALPTYLILLIIPVISLVLIRKKYFKTAKVILMASGNLVVFWIALNDPLETGVYLFFIPAAIGSFAMLAFEHYKTGIALACMTTLLFLIAFYGDFRPMHLPRPSDQYIKTSFVANYFISLTVSVLIVYFLMNLNKVSETHLMRKNRQLQKVNKELDRFVYSVSHDLRSPLSSILGLINIAKLSNDPGEITHILSLIQGRVNAQDHFIREIIDYARNARTETTIETVNLHQLTNEVIDSLRFNLDANRIDFQNTIPADHNIQSDRIRLTIILSNLISNAIKYHDFTKDYPFIEIGINETQPGFFVQDNGIGMRAEDQQKIFNMFYRGSDRSSGSGLGLFITQEAVAKLNGTIDVQSTHTKGSIFTVRL